MIWSSGFEDSKFQRNIITFPSESPKPIPGILLLYLFTPELSCSSRVTWTFRRSWLFLCIFFCIHCKSSKASPTHQVYIGAYNAGIGRPFKVLMHFWKNLLHDRFENIVCLPARLPLTFKNSIPATKFQSLTNAPSKIFFGEMRILKIYTWECKKEEAILFLWSWSNIKGVKIQGEPEFQVLIRLD